MSAKAQPTSYRPTTTAEVDLSAIASATSLKRSLSRTGLSEDLALPAVLKEIESLLPDSSRTQPVRFFAGLVRCARQNPALVKCTLASIVEALKIAAQVDVVPGDGRAYLIPYGTECQFMLGAHGMRDVIRRSDQVLDINDQAVYEGDEFEFELEGPNRGVRHKRRLGGEGGRKWLCAYAVATLKGDPRPIVEIIDAADLAAIKSVSKAAGSMAWQKFGDEMSRAKVLRRLAKRLPMRPDDDAALAAADAVEFYQVQAAAAERPQPVRASVPLSAVRKSVNENRGHDGANPAHVEADRSDAATSEAFGEEEGDPSDDAWWDSGKPSAA